MFRSMEDRMDEGMIFDTGDQKKKRRQGGGGARRKPKPSFDDEDEGDGDDSDGDEFDEFEEDDDDELSYEAYLKWKKQQLKVNYITPLLSNRAESRAWLVHNRDLACRRRGRWRARATERAACSAA
jgi:hypothetical protein